MDLSPGQASQAVISAHAAAGRDFTSDFCDRILRNEFKALEKYAGGTRSKAEITEEKSVFPQPGSPSIKTTLSARCKFLIMEISPFPELLSVNILNFRFK